MGYTIPTYVDSRKRIKAFKRGSKLEVLVKDLPAQSNVRISAECEACGNIRVVAYSKYSILCWCCNLKNMKGTRHGNYDENFEVTGQDREFPTFSFRGETYVSLEAYEFLNSILSRSAKWIPHIPVSYEAQMGGAMNGPCTEDCPKCAIHKLYSKGRSK